MITIMDYIKHLNYYLSEHPSIVTFRWSTTQSFGSTWSFLIFSISTYVALSLTLHTLLRLSNRHRPIPLGPIPALHNLLISLLSIGIFAGIFSSSIAEIRYTKWIWIRSKTPFQYLLCFPLGTRSSGRIFFWSHIFYVSRYLHICTTFFKILKRPQKFPVFDILHHSVLIVTSFLWLEFSQSVQVLAIMSLTLVFALTCGFGFFVGIGVVKVKRFDFGLVRVCWAVLVVVNMGWNLGVLVLHFWKGGCNGFGAWAFNSVINGLLGLFVVKFYVKKCLSERDFGVNTEVRRKLVSSNGS